MCYNLISLHLFQAAAGFTMVEAGLQEEIMAEATEVVEEEEAVAAVETNGGTTKQCSIGWIRNSFICVQKTPLNYRTTTIYVT